jgi:hypothetical protein
MKKVFLRIPFFPHPSPLPEGEGIRVFFSQRERVLEYSSLRGRGY